MKLSYDYLRKLVLEELSKTDGVTVLESPDVLAEKSILKNKNPFKAIYVLGPAGAGKSFLSGQIGIPKDFKTSNPDERIESVFPAFGMSMKFKEFEKGDEKNASPEAKAQQTAREVLQNAEQAHTANLLATASPIVFDTTGEAVQKMIPRIEALSKVGYDIGIFMINVPTDVSVDRDKKRDRTVGEPTKHISKQYQKKVVQDRAYFKKFAANDMVTIFGGDIYANLYDLRDNSLLPGITDAHVSAMKTAKGEPYTPEYAAALLDRARGELSEWLGEPRNPTGQTLLKGMRALVKASKGKLGQNMLQIGPAVAQGIGTDNADVMAAAKLIADMGGVEVPLAQSQRKQKKAGETFGVDDPSIRGMSGKTDGTETPLGGELSTGKKRRFEESAEAALAEKVEKIIWKMLNQNR